MLNVMHHSCVIFIRHSSHFCVNEIICFQKLVGNLDRIIIVNLGRLHKNS